jgi:trimethylamine--corrinoid protein Co-methyltransferase
MSSVRMNDKVWGGAQYSRLSGEQCQKLHNASLEILARTGARLYDAEALELLKRAGAQVTEGNRVRIPAGLVEKAFSTVPKRCLYERRVGGLYLEEGTATTAGSTANIVDHRTRAAEAGAMVREVSMHWSIDFVM